MKELRLGVFVYFFFVEKQAELTEEGGLGEPESGTQEFPVSSAVGAA